MGIDSEVKDGDGKQQKIRGSCDACSAQKIRCTKQRPTCGRCLNKGIPCEYGLSMRTGRRSGPSQNTGQSRNEDGVAGPSIRPSKAPTPFGLDEEMPALSSQGFEIQTESSSFDFNDDTWMFDDLLTDASQQNDAALFGDFSTMVTTSDPNQSLVATTMAVEDPILTIPNALDFSSWSNSRRTRFDSVLQPSQGTGEMDAQLTDPALHDHISCMSTALQIIVELHVSTQTCFSSASNTLFGTQNVNEEARDINTVLDYNRQALWKAVRVLDCPCSKEPGVIGAVCMAVHKVLSWYAAAIGVDDVSQVPADRVTNPPIYMGNYCLDPQAQKLARAHVVLSELREHVQPLLARLDRLQPASSMSSSMASIDSSRGSPIPPPTPPDLDVIECHRRGLWEEFNALTSNASSTQKG